MHNKKYIVTLVLLCFFFIPSSQAHVLSPHVTIEAHLDSSTTQLYIGDITLQANFSGFSINQINCTISYFDVQEYSFYPLLTTITTSLLDTLLIVETSAVDTENINMTQIYQLIDDNDSSLTRLHSVSLSTTAGLFLLGSPSPTIDIQQQYSFSIAGVFQHSLFSEEIIPFFFLFSQQAQPLFFSNTDNASFLIQPSGSSSVIVSNSENEAIWNGAASDHIFVFIGSDITIVQDVCFQLFPLDNLDTVSYSLEVTPSQDAFVDTSLLLQQASMILQETTDSSLENFKEAIQSYSNGFSLVSSIFNGVMVVIQPTNPLIVEETFKPVSTIAFIRGDSFQVIKQDATEVVSHHKI